MALAHAIPHLLTYGHAYQPQTRKDYERKRGVTGDEGQGTVQSSQEGKENSAAGTERRTHMCFVHFGLILVSIASLANMLDPDIDPLGWN